jgi:hypothetical protein
MEVEDDERVDDKRVPHHLFAAISGGARTLSKKIDVYLLEVSTLF